MVSVTTITKAYRQSSFVGIVTAFNATNAVPESGSTLALLLMATSVCAAFAIRQRRDAVV